MSLHEQAYMKLVNVGQDIAPASCPYLTESNIITLCCTRFNENTAPKPCRYPDRSSCLQTTCAYLGLYTPMPTFEVLIGMFFASAVWRQGYHSPEAQERGLRKKSKMPTSIHRTTRSSQHSSQFASFFVVFQSRLTRETDAKECPTPYSP